MIDGHYLCIKSGRQRWELVCFGAKGHYRKDGTCRHTEAVLASLRPWYRSRTHVWLWGNR